MPVVYKIQDSFSGEVLEESDANKIALSVGGEKWELFLSDDSVKKLYEAIDPFVKNEKPTGKKQPKITPAVREKIRVFAKKKNLGEVGARGRINYEIYEAWVEAGKP